jgi:DNA ligase-1
LIAPASDGGGTTAHPYPFFLAHPLNAPVETLGDAAQWLVEWKWDGIRAQLVRRGRTTCLWSRGEELITDRFPEVVNAARGLPPGIVLDGELLAFADGRPRPFADLQQRIGRQRRVQEVAADIPVVFVAYDLLESDGEDFRARPLRERRDRLVTLLAGPASRGPAYDEPASRGPASTRLTPAARPAANAAPGRGERLASTAP